MKKNRVFKSLSFISAICIVAGLSVFHSCKEDVEPSFTANEIDYLVKVTVEDHESKAPLSDVTALVTYPDKTQKTTLLSDGTLSIDMDNRADGELILQFSKKNYISVNDTITVDRSQVDEGAVCDFLTKVMLSKITASFHVTTGVEMGVDMADIHVSFHEKSLTSDADISITEIASTDEIASESGEIELMGGRDVLKSIVFLPHGQEFAEAIDVTFPIPDTDEDLEFSTLTDAGVWETVTVTKNGDGTGTAQINHFSDWILSTHDRWKVSNLGFSDLIEFTGDCDDDLVATFEKSFDTDETAAKADLPISLHYDLSDTKIVHGHKGYQKSVSYKHMIIGVKNVSKGYTIQLPSFPIEWEASTEETCHTGGSGN